MINCDPIRKRCELETRRVSKACYDLCLVKIRVRKIRRSNESNLVVDEVQEVYLYEIK